MVVLDASVALSWVLPGEMTPQSKAILEKLIADDEIFTSPAIWPQEVANAIWVNLIRRNRLDQAQAQQALEYLNALDVKIDASDIGRCFTSVFPLAFQHQLTIYDASYLELAWRLGCPILTDDEQVIAAATAMKLELYAV